VRSGARASGEFVIPLAGGDKVVAGDGDDVGVGLGVVELNVVGASRCAGVRGGVFSIRGRAVGLSPAYWTVDFVSSALRTTCRISLLFSRFAFLVGDVAVRAGVELGLAVGVGVAAKVEVGFGVAAGSLAHQEEEVDGCAKVEVGFGVAAGGLASAFGDGETTDVVVWTPMISCFSHVIPPSLLEASKPPVPTIHRVLVFGTRAMSRIFELISVSRRIALVSIGCLHHARLKSGGALSGSGRGGCWKATTDAVTAKTAARRK
jgi:hypothetical protein